MSGSIDKAADIASDIGEYIKQQRSSAKISLRQLSKLAGVSNPYLSQIERGVRKPSAEVLQQIANGLRISAEALYVQAGFLQAPQGGPVLDAIRADEALSERQKQVLLDVYESFRRENAAAEREPEPARETGAADIPLTPQAEEVSHGPSTGEPGSPTHPRSESA